MRITPIVSKFAFRQKLVKRVVNGAHKRHQFPIFKRVWYRCRCWTEITGPCRNGADAIRLRAVSETPRFGQVPADSAAVRAGYVSPFPRTVAACTLFPAGVTYGSGNDAATARAAPVADAALIDGFPAVGDGATGFAYAKRVRFDGFAHGRGRPTGFMHVRPFAYQLNFLNVAGRGAWAWLSLWRKLIRPLVRS